MPEVRTGDHPTDPLSPSSTLSLHLLLKDCDVKILRVRVVPGARRRRVRPNDCAATQTHTYACTRARTHTCTCTQTDKCTCTRTRTHTNMHAHTCMHARARAHTHTHTHSPGVKYDHMIVLPKRESEGGSEAGGRREGGRVRGRDALGQPGSLQGILAAKLPADHIFVEQRGLQPRRPPATL